MTTTIPRTLAIILMLTACLASQSMASQNDLAKGSVANELQSLATSIDNLTQLLNDQSQASDQDTKLRKLDIAISYLNFRSRRIEMFERDLQATRASRNRLEDLMEQFSREEERFSQGFDINQQDDLKRAQEEMAMRRQVIKGRIGRMDEEIILLENRIMDMQSQIDSVESFVQKNLEF